VGSAGEHPTIRGNPPGPGLTLQPAHVSDFDPLPIVSPSPTHDLSSAACTAWWKRFYLLGNQGEYLPAMSAPLVRWRLTHRSRPARQFCAKSCARSCYAPWSTFG